MINNDTPVVGAITADAGNVGATSVVLSGSFSEVNAQLSKIKEEIYTITITKAGDINVAEFTVTTLSGEDNADPVLITDKDGVAEFAIGTCGQKIKFTDAALFDLNDKWTFTVSKQNLSASLRIIKSSIEIGRYRENLTTEEAWTPGDDDITIMSDIEKSDSTWRDGEYTIPILGGNLFCQYKTFVPYTGEIDSVSAGASQSEVESKLYDISNESYLGKAVYFCAQNSEYNAVKFLGLATNDNTGWDNAIDKIKKVSDVYFIVPVSGEKGILEKFQFHVNQMSTSVSKKWRRVIACIIAPETEDVLVEWTDDMEVDHDYTATVRENPDDGNKINLFDMSDGQGTNLIGSGIISGYKVRYSYRTEESGETYTIYTIDEIINETSFTITDELDDIVPIAAKIEIYKILSHAKEKNYIKDYAASLNDRRICLVFPDEFIDSLGVSSYGFYLASAITGVAASVDPQAPITNKTMNMISSVPKIFNEYTEDDLDELANAGVMLVTQDSSSSIPYIRHQLTTNVSSTEYAELSPGKNVDEISYYILSQLADYPGRYNLTDGTIEAIRFIITKAIEYKKEFSDPLIGGQLISGVIDSIEQNATQKTKLDIVLDLVVPGPLNNISVTEKISI